jgi:cleavage and polyadenylation specificity factor subunit 2
MESVVYAVDWNQAREHVLSGAAWLGGSGTGGSEILGQLRRPTALICSSRGTDMVKVATPLNKRDETLVDMIRDTIAKGGSVLIPSDSSARILELAYLLEETFAREISASNGQSPWRAEQIYLASRTGGATMRYVRSMLEWMEEGIAKTAQVNATDQDRYIAKSGGDENKAAIGPFDFRHITLLERKKDVARMLAATRPRVILASDATLEWGFSKDAIRSLASDQKNLVILTERAGALDAQKKGLGRYLWDLWNQRNASPGQDAPSATVVDASGDQAPIRSIRTMPLEGDEVPLYQQFLASQRQRQITMGGMGGENAAMLETSADVVDDTSSRLTDSTEGSEDGMQGRLLNATADLLRAQHKVNMTDEEMGVTVLIHKKGVYDYEVQGKRGKDAMFPFQAKKHRTDDFGDLIRPEDFARAEEEDNTAAEARGDGTKKENAIGQKRRWDDVAKKEEETKAAAAKEKRQKDREGQEGAEGEESDSEPEDDPDKVDGPSKVIIESETLDIRCRIAFVDFSGLHDRRAIQQLIPLIRPRKLIFVGGEKGETLELAEISRIALNANTDSANAIDVFTPTVGMMIDASVDTNAWTVKLSRSMVRNLRWQNVGGMGVVAITGRLAAASLDPEPTDLEADTPAKKKARLDAPAIPVSSDKSATTPVLDVVPANMATAVRSVAQPFHVGDLRLADLRKLMNANGMQAEFRGEGVLVINGTVAVRKTATGQIELDGGAYGNLDSKNNDAATLYRVRRQIYEGLAVVAGG